MRELRIRSGSRHRTTRPSLASSIGSHWLRSTYSRFRFFSRSDGLMRSALNGSYGTPKNFDSAAPIAGSLTWNSSISTVSMSIAFLRAWRDASSNSPGRQHRVGDQVVVLGLDHLRLLPLLERDRQRLRELDHAFLGQRPERHARLVVDDLDDADQLGAALLDDRRHQHLLGAVAGALVHFLQEAQVRIDRLQLGLVVAVLDVDQSCATARRSRRSSARRSAASGP